MYPRSKAGIAQTVDNILRTSNSPFSALLNYMMKSKLSSEGLSANFRSGDKFEKAEDPFDKQLNAALAAIDLRSTKKRGRPKRDSSGGGSSAVAEPLSDTILTLLKMRKE